MPSVPSQDCSSLADHAHEDSSRGPTFWADVHGHIKEYINLRAEKFTVISLPKCTLLWLIGKQRDSIINLIQVALCK